MNFQFHPRSWERFFSVPLILLFSISIIINLLKLLIPEGLSAVPLLMIPIFIVIILIPYSMLKLAPKHCYIATIMYMMGLWSGLMILQFIMQYISDQPFRLNLFLLFFISTMIAMMLYRILNDPNELEQNSEES